MNKRPYQDLIAWKEANCLCLWVYKKTKSFPSSERFGLIQQMRRSAYSVPMNIVEGNARRSRKEKARFFEIALGSLEELHYQCHLALQLQYVSQKEFDEADAMINRVSFLITKLRNAFVVNR